MTQVAESDVGPLDVLCHDRRQTKLRLAQLERSRQGFLVVWWAVVLSAPVNYHQIELNRSWPVMILISSSAAGTPRARTGLAAAGNEVG